MKISELVTEEGYELFDRVTVNVNSAFDKRSITMIRGRTQFLSYEDMCMADCLEITINQEHPADDKKKLSSAYLAMYIEVSDGTGNDDFIEAIRDINNDDNTVLEVVDVEELIDDGDYDILQLSCNSGTKDPWNDQDFEIRRYRRGNVKDETDPEIAKGIKALACIEPYLWQDPNFVGRVTKKEKDGKLILNILIRAYMSENLSAYIEDFIEEEDNK